MKSTAAIILAAGKSTRMGGATPKVLHEVCGRSMLGWVLDACAGAGVERFVVVVGHGKQAVMAAFADEPSITWVEQSEQKGTGHAALVCQSALGDFDGRTIVMAGDMPLVRSETLSSLLEANASARESVTLASSVFDDSTGYGRIVRDGAGRLAGIVEHADCTDEQRRIREVNISYYCFDNRKMFDALRQIKPNNAKGEYYITDAVHILIKQGCGASAMASVKPEDAMGVNSRADLALVNSIMQRRIQDEWLSRGVTIVNRENTWIETGCRIGSDTVIQPFSFIRRGAQIGEGCRIGPYSLVMEDDVVPAGGVTGPVPTAGANLS